MYLFFLLGSKPKLYNVETEVLIANYNVQSDVVNGTFWPAYVLCKSYTTSEKRSGYKIVKIQDGIQLKSNPRLLFTETIGHEDMINFMSSYQCQDKKGKHYHPHGHLCWYGCNQYGEMNGYIQPIKRVPEYVWIFDFKRTHGNLHGRRNPKRQYSNRYRSF